MAAEVADVAVVVGGEVADGVCVVVVMWLEVERRKIAERCWLTIASGTGVYDALRMMCETG